MDLIRSLSWISASHLRLVRDDDSHVDRLSHRYTVAICVLFAIIVSTKQYAGDPIDCWVSSAGLCVESQWPFEPNLLLLLTGSCSIQSELREVRRFLLLDCR